MRVNRWSDGRVDVDMVEDERIKLLLELEYLRGTREGCPRLLSDLWLLLDRAEVRPTEVHDYDIPLGHDNFRG